YGKSEDIGPADTSCLLLGPRSATQRRLNGTGAVCSATRAARTDCPTPVSELKYPTRLTPNCGGKRDAGASQRTAAVPLLTSDHLRLNLARKTGRRSRKLRACTDAPIAIRTT